MWKRIESNQVHLVCKVHSVSLEAGCSEPLATGEERYYAAAIVVEGGFVSGRVAPAVQVDGQRYVAQFGQGVGTRR